jgi:hypothetical protein
VIVEDQVIVKRKVVGALRDGHVAQCRNDVRATGKPLCLGIGFGRPKVEIRHVTPSRTRVLAPLTRVLAPLTRVLARPSLIARTIPFIPFIPAYPAHPP